jgi:YD repeat-containing protein
VRSTSSLTYAYDGAGNRLTRTSHLPSLDAATYAYDSNDRLTSDTYDANGNTLVGRVSPSAPLVIDTYDSENRLTTRHSSLATVHLQYDGDGHRVSKTITTDTGSSTSYYVVDDLNPTGYPQVLEELITDHSSLVTPEVTRVLTWAHSLLAQDRFDGTAWTESYYNDPVNRHDPSGHFSMAEMSMVSGLTPMVRGLGMDLFSGVMNYAHGLGGGSALKATSRAEAYMIDSLAQGAGWQLGKLNFWAVMKGAPFLLSWNPNITPTSKPCYYECITFDEDVPIYGPAAQHPIFEFDEDPFATWLNTDHADWWFKDLNFPPPRSTDSFLENVYHNAHSDAQRYSNGFSKSGAHGVEGLIRLGFNALMDPGGTGSKVVQQVAAGLQELPEQVARVVNDPMPVVDHLWQALQTPEGTGELVFDAEALLAGFAVKLPLPKGFKPPLRLPARALAPARSLVGPTEAVCRKPLGNALDWAANASARAAASMRRTLGEMRDRLANRAVSEGAAAVESSYLPSRQGVNYSLRTVDEVLGATSAATAGRVTAYGVSFFDRDIADRILTNPRLGRLNEPHFFMAVEDSATIRDAFDASRFSGRSPGTDRALIAGEPIYGLAFPTDGLGVRGPTSADAGGWAHYLEGGRTAVRTSLEPTGGFLVNPTREYIVPGGRPMPSGSVLFQLGSNGEWIIVNRW